MADDIDRQLSTLEAFLEQLRRPANYLRDVVEQTRENLGGGAAPPGDFGERVNYLAGAAGQTWPAKMVKSAYGAVTLPGDVYQGNVTSADPAYYERAADLAGLVTGGSYVAPAQKGAVGMGIRAYHGSPHDFDKFDLAKIGTGEGAQAYGHGLYFAEREGVAQDYRRRLAGKAVSLADTAKKHLPEMEWDQSSLGRVYSASLNGDKDALKEARRLQMRFPELRDEGASMIGPVSPKQEKVAKLIEELRDQGRGRMYEVDIKANPEQFLDWDKPLSQQSEAVQALAMQRGIDPKNVPHYRGEDVYRDIQANEAFKLPIGDTRTGAAATPAFREAGIPGIRYLDGGSRAAGDGSRNYVVFDPSLVEIMRKYGIAGIAAMPAVAGSKDDAFAAQLERDLKAIMQ